jgi:hypothetical protein
MVVRKARTTCGQKAGSFEMTWSQTCWQGEPLGEGEHGYSKCENRPCVCVAVERVDQAAKARRNLGGKHTATKKPRQGPPALSGSTFSVPQSTAAHLEPLVTIEDIRHQ